MNTKSIFSSVARLTTIAAAVALPLAAHVAPAAAQTLDRDVRYVLPFEMLEGKPDVDPGRGLGYWIWHDDAGLHLRTTTHGLEHDFNGVIRTGEASKLVDVDGYRLEDKGANQDRVTQPEQNVVRFHFDTWDGVDGLDFRLDGDMFCVNLENDGREATDMVHIGQYELKPDSLPVCFRR